MFGQLQDALNTIWEVQPAPAGIVGSVKRRIVPLSMVLGIGFMLLVSLVLSARHRRSSAPFSEISYPVQRPLAGCKHCPLTDRHHAAIRGNLQSPARRGSELVRRLDRGILTSLLFVIGKTLIGIYLGHSSVGSTYGAAGSLLVFLVWVYYSAQILFFGAEFTQVYARQRGKSIVPSQGAVPLTAEAKAEQGLKPTAPVRPQAATAATMSAAGPFGRAHSEPARDPGALKKLIWTGLSAAPSLSWASSPSV